MITIIYEDKSACLRRYCESCWLEYYGERPQDDSNALVAVEAPKASYKAFTKASRIKTTNYMINYRHIYNVIYNAIYMNNDDVYIIIDLRVAGLRHLVRGDAGGGLGRDDLARLAANEERDPTAGGSRQAK